MIEEKLLSLVQGLYQAIGWPGVLVLMAVESACIPFPSEIIMPFAGWFLVREAGLGVPGMLFISVVGAVGNVLGSLVAYYAGMAGGRPFLVRYGRYVLVSPHELDMADRLFAKYGEWIVLVSRLLPVIRTFISFPAGVSRMNVWRFSAYTLVGAYPFCFALTYGGYVLGEHWETVHAFTRPFAYPIAAACVLAVLWYVWHRWKKMRAPAA